MRIRVLLPTVLATSAMLSSLSAQEPRVVRIGPGGAMAGGRFDLLAGDARRAVIGVSTSAAATARDTLGVLVSAVRSGSPAEKAGIEEGNRIASVNGVSLKLAAADIGDDQMAGVMSRRLSRELDKLKPGDEVDLRVYANGQTKSVKVKTIAPADLYASQASRRRDDRPTLGLNLAVTGSARDSLGVFVMSVDDGGPAAKAGIEEGSRITSINGVDLRVHRSADDDLGLHASTVSRLEREVSRVKPGDEVDLRVFYNGQSRTVKLRAARAGDLPRHTRSMMIMGSDGAIPFGDMPLGEMRIEMPHVGDEIRRAVEAGVAGLPDMVRVPDVNGLRAIQSLPFGARAFGRMNW